MRIQQKIALNVCFLVSASLLMLALVLTEFSRTKATSALLFQTEQRFVALRDVKKEQIEIYFEQIENQIITLAASAMTESAATEFIHAFGTFRAGEADAQNKLDALSQYYRNDFLRKYKNLNPDKSLDSDNLVQDLHTTGVELQYAFIANNPHPLGEKHLLDKLNDTSTYNNSHTHYHPHYKQYLEKFGYYDIFIVDRASGNVVYSVFKELDFATSLKDGSYSQSGLGRAFNNALALMPGSTYITDFSPYTPSYEGAASFISSPIGEDAILIFQMPVERINGIMTFQKKWKERGMGNSGETYLVGSDLILRSESRLLSEDKNSYIQALKKTGNDSKLVAEIEAKELSLGLQPVRTEAARLALKGKTGFQKIIGYHGKPVYSAYSPINIDGLDWAIVSEMEEAEVLANAITLTSDLRKIGLTFTLAILTVAGLAAFFLGRWLSKPVINTQTTVEDIANTLHISKRLSVRETQNKDEIQNMALAINHMLDAFCQVIGQVRSTEQSMVESVKQLDQSVSVVFGASNKQREMTLSMSTALEELSATSRVLLQDVEQNQTASTKTQEQANAGLSVMQENEHATKQLAEVLSKTAKHVSEVAEQSHSIFTFLDVIGDIAEQTNLLALNAAIEAARAGEQGRGFAVVADEVRTLAKRTQDSTKEIQNIIERLRQGSTNSVNVMNQAQSILEVTMSAAIRASQNFDEINNQLGQITQKNTHLSSAAQEQAQVTAEMTANVTQISLLAEQNSELMDQVNRSTKQVTLSNEELARSIRKFGV